jgi:trehalose-6-phosphate synthase
MNLVAFEFVACQGERHGVLVISEFVGAAAYMDHGSVLFHPANLKEIAVAIYRGLTMDENTRQESHEKLRDFIEHNTRYAPFRSFPTWIVSLSFIARISTDIFGPSARWGTTFVGQLIQYSA